MGGAHPTTLKESQELIQALTALFCELDVSASGSVSMEELVAGLDRLGYDIRQHGGCVVCLGCVVGGGCVGIGGEVGSLGGGQGVLVRA